MPTMPKKTKKQKIKAMERRNLQPASSSIHFPPSKSEYFSVPSYQLRNQPQTAAIKYNPVDLRALQIVRQDLVKTIIFAGIAIMIEIVLSYFVR